MKSSISFAFFVFSILALNFSNISAQNTQKPISRESHVEKTTDGKKSVSLDSEEKYDAKGNVIEEIEYKDGKIDKHMVYEYDSNNFRIKETEMDGSKPKKISEIKYENGLRKEKLTYDLNKKLLSKKTYTYKY
jgi:antitoxin component YwqK of YwqJK toxin-antitoxin module